MTDKILRFHSAILVWALLATVTLGQEWPEQPPEQERGEEEPAAVYTYPPSLEVGLIAYYGFEATDPAQDMSGNGWNGLASGLSLIPGVVGKAASFDGTGGLLVDAFRNVEWGEEFSLSLWVKRPKTASKGYLSVIGNYGFDDSYFSSFAISLGSEDGGRRLWVYMQDESDEKNPNFMPGNIDLDKWHHLVLMYDYGKSRLFVDGVEQMSFVTRRGPLRVMNEPLQIACTKFLNKWRRSDLQLDEIRLYNRVLSLDEINELGIDAMEASSLPASERPEMVRLATSPAAVEAKPIMPPRQPRRPAMQRAPAASPPVAPSPRGGNPASSSSQGSSAWWTESEPSGLADTTDARVILETWKELWRTGQKQAVIDDLNRMAGE